MGNIFICDTINDSMVNKVVQGLVEHHKTSETICVYINSDGGYDGCDYAIYEALRLSGKKIVTYAINAVHSSALTIYLAGNERYVTNYSNFLIHEPYDSFDGKMNVRTYQHSHKRLIKIRQDYYDFISKHCKLTVEDIRKSIKESPSHDWNFGPKDAIEYGIATHIGLPLIDDKTIVAIIAESNEDE